MTDVIALLIIAFFAFIGWRKGFWQYSSELLITAVSLFIAWQYYQQNHQVFKSLLVFICVFLGLWLLKWFLLKVSEKRAPQKTSFSSINRVLGLALGMIWGMFIVILVILSLDLLPTEKVLSFNIQDDLRASYACPIAHRLVPIEKVGILENISYMSKISDNKEAQLKLMEQPEFEDLLQHKSFKAVMEDEELVNQLQNKDLRSLLGNPKIRELLNDGQFIEKIMQLDFKKALKK